jgi:hypothetical protein
MDDEREIQRPPGIRRDVGVLDQSEMEIGRHGRFIIIICHIIGGRERDGELAREQPIEQGRSQCNNHNTTQHTS